MDEDEVGEEFERGDPMGLVFGDRVKTVMGTV
jgi:hypothetical protein